MSVNKINKSSLEFFDNLTLGLIRALPNNLYIKEFKVKQNMPCTIFELKNWEQKYNIKLPKDMENFYLSTDGFRLTWSFQYSKSNIRPLGNLRIPSLNDIKTLHIDNYDIVNLTAQHFLDSLLSSKNNDHDLPQPKINGNTKIFELSQVSDVAKVCLVYENEESLPQIYLFEMETFKWIFLAENFSQYLRMAIIHLGLPLWELSFSSYGLPPWVQQLFLVLAPHLLKPCEERHKKYIIPLRENHFHKLDEKIFKMKLVKKKNHRTDLKNR